MEIRGAWMCLGGIWVLSPAVWSQNSILAQPKKAQFFFHLTIPRHQNTKTVAYKLSKHDWVRPFLEFLGLPEKNYLSQLLLITL